MSVIGWPYLATEAKECLLKELLFRWRRERALQSKQQVQKEHSEYKRLKETMLVTENMTVQDKAGDAGDVRPWTDRTS